jgi:hypothetical protein
MVSRERGTDRGWCTKSGGLFGVVWFLPPPWLVLLREKKYHRLLLDVSLDLGSNLLDCMKYGFITPVHT